MEEKYYIGETEIMEYELKELMKCRNFERLCEIFFELAPDDEVRSKLECILYKGRYSDFQFSSNICISTPPMEIERRVGMAYLLLRNPETFNVLCENHINIFHGVNANALSSVLKYGLVSSKEAKKRGIPISTGVNSNTDYVSFSDVIDIAKVYASIKNKVSQENLAFEVVFGTTTLEISARGAHPVNRGFPELGVNSELPVESIKVILVPSDKIDFVRKLVDCFDIPVFALDDYYTIFYHVSYDNDGYITIFDNKLQDFKNSLDNTLNNKVFQSDEIKSAVQGRLLSNIKIQFEKIKDFIIGVDELKNDRRNIK